MPNDLSAFVAILVIAGVTFGARLLGPLIMQNVGSSERVERFLEALSASVITAIVATAIARGGYREAAAVAVAATVMGASKSAVWAMIAGMVFAAGWTAIAG